MVVPFKVSLCLKRAGRGTHPSPTHRACFRCRFCCLGMKQSSWHTHSLASFREKLDLQKALFRFQPCSTFWDHDIILSSTKFSLKNYTIELKKITQNAFFKLSLGFCGRPHSLLSWNTRAVWTRGWVLTVYEKSARPLGWNGVEDTGSRLLHCTLEQRYGPCCASLSLGVTWRKLCSLSRVLWTVPDSPSSSSSKIQDC